MWKISPENHMGDMIMESGFPETWETISSQKSLIRANPILPELLVTVMGTFVASKTWWVCED